MEEIVTVHQFRQVKQKGQGYIAIIDHASPVHRVHSTKCIDVTERSFTQKAMISGRSPGKYYYTDDYKDALKQFQKMRPCAKCI